jgi:hypothetical protein
LTTQHWLSHAGSTSIKPSSEARNEIRNAAQHHAPFLPQWCRQGQRFVLFDKLSTFADVFMGRQVDHVLERLGELDELLAYDLPIAIQLRFRLFL